MQARDKFQKIVKLKKEKQQAGGRTAGTPLLLGDGAMGTELMKISSQTAKIPLAYNLKSPEEVKKIHRRYLAAGADIIISNTFCANRLYLKQTGLAAGKNDLTELVKKINQQGVRLAGDAVRELQQKITSTSCCPLTAGSIGPTGSEKAIFPEQNSNQEKLEQAFREQITALIKGGIDLLLFETFSYHLELKAALRAAEEFELPWIVNMSFDRYNSTNYGTSPEDFSSLVREFPREKILAAGINCIAPDPGYRETIDRITAELAPLPLSIYYNAGTPELDVKTGKASYQLEESFFQEAGETAGRDEPEALILGGCCGTSPETISRLKKQLEGDL